VGEKSLDTMVQWLEQHPTAGIAGPFLVNGAFEPRLELTPCHFPSLTSLLITALKLPLLFPFILHRFYYSMGELSHDLQVDTLRGSALFMRRELVDALGFAFDPRYFIWFEDVDICREAYRLGFKVMYVNSVKMVDYRGQSFKKQDMVKKQKQFFKSAIIYLKKWEPRYKSIILWIVQWFGIGGVWVYSKSGRKLKMKDAIER
jgi:GT2 family glycosyltransferase